MIEINNSLRIIRFFKQTIKKTNYPAYTEDEKRTLFLFFFYFLVQNGNARYFPDHRNSEAQFCDEAVLYAITPPIAIIDYQCITIS